MPSLPNQNADVHFGYVGKPLPDWRKSKALALEDDPDDELLPVTDPYVIAALGFDPRELADEPQK
jgi:hypothetical protein